MGCLDDNTVAAYICDPADEVRLRVENHVDDCARCRRLIAHVVKQGATRRVEATMRAVNTPARLRPGFMLGRFRIERHIGSGGMGDVYAARDTELGRRVALKLIRPDLIRSHEALQRFRVEARAMARFSHPNIISVFEIGDLEGVPFLALEYLEGESLRQRIGPCLPDDERDATPALPRHEALRIATAVADALAEAHRHHVLHRDLKPSNVHIASDGHVRVLDFGLAKLIDADAPGSSRVIGSARSGQVSEALADTALAGTPGYLAPERWTGKVSTRAADVWAFGVLLFELVSGVRPYRGDSLEALADAVLNAPPPPLPPRTPARLAALVHACLDADADQRPSAEQLAATLRELAERGPLTAHEQGAPATQRDRNKRPRLWGALVAALAVGALASLYIGTASEPRAPQAPADGSLPCVEKSPPRDDDGRVTACTLSHDVTIDGVECRRMGKAQRHRNGVLKTCVLGRALDAALACEVGSAVWLYPSGDVHKCSLGSEQTVSKFPCGGVVEVYPAGSLKRCQLARRTPVAIHTAAKSSWITLSENGRASRLELPDDHNWKFKGHICSQVHFHDDGSIKVCVIKDGSVLGGWRCFDPDGSPSTDYDLLCSDFVGEIRAGTPF